MEDPRDQFKQSVLRAVERFRCTDKQKTVRIISNYDADGIAACAILIRAMEHENRPYSTTILQQLSEPLVESLAKEPYNLYLFSDIGTGHLNLIAEKFSGKQVFILDHHELTEQQNYPNLTLVNPHLVGIDGGKEISAAGVAFLFAVMLNRANRNMAHIAIVGAVGDVQEDNGFLSLNQEILEMAQQENIIRVERGLRCFGVSTRPLHKILEYNSDPYIPGVSGSESGAIHFLQQLGIDPKKGNSWKTLRDLTDEEMGRLITGIILRRNGEKNPEDVLGFNYVLLKEKEGTPFRNAKEFATLLNACGRFNKASLGIGACLGNPKMKAKAMQHLQTYKRAVVQGMEWIRSNKGTRFVQEEDGFLIINAEDNINSAIIGTLASIMSKSGDIPEGTFILGLAQTDVHTTKVSLRMAGRDQEIIPLHEVVREIVERVGGEAGGHSAAAGAMIPIEQEGAFIEAAKEVFLQRIGQQAVTVQRQDLTGSV